MAATRQSLRRAFVFFLVNLTTLRAQSLPLQFVLTQDLEPWHRLKRQVKHVMDSHPYRGGLHELTKCQVTKAFMCSAQNDQFCTGWTSKANATEEQESDSCSCHEERSSYCSYWTCVHKLPAAVNNGSTRVCRDESQTEHTICSCKIKSSNAKYCEEWSCSQVNADGTVDDLKSVCLREDISGQYCAHWKENIVSNREADASLCKCEESGSHYCSRWICQKRSNMKCDAHNSRWCKLEPGLCLGGLSAAFILFSLAVSLKGAPLQKRWQCFLGAIVCLCLPRVVSVAIWGGAGALMYVAGVWGILFTLTRLFLCWFKY